MNIRAHKVFITAAAVVAVFAVFFFISNFLTRIRASTTKAFISSTGVPPLPVTKPRAVVNVSAPFPCVSGQNRATAIYIKADQPVGGISSNKISAFDLTFKVTGSWQINSVNSPSTYPGGDTSIFTPVIVPPSIIPTSSPATTSVRLAYVIQKPTAELPTGVLFYIGTKETGSGTCSLTLDGSAKQEVVGAIGSGADNTYEVVVSTHTVSVTPVAGVTNTTAAQPSPTGTSSTCVKERGDSDCDGDTDDDDFKKWRSQYDKLIPDKPWYDNANFVCRELEKISHWVDLKDFEAWRRGRWLRH